MTAPLVTALRPDGTPHPWRATSTPSYGPPQPMVPSPALVAAGFRERTVEDMRGWWRR